MSKIGKIFWVFSALALITGTGAAYFGAETKLLVVPFGIFAVLSIIAIVKDLKFYAELMTMRTTKHGLNMGTLILIFMSFLVILNFVASKNNKKWDLTEEKLNSLSDQSSNLISGLSEDLEVYAFFRDNTPMELQGKARFQNIIRLFEAKSPKVKVQYINPLKRPDLAKKYDLDTSGIVVLSYKGKQNKITDFTEEEITNSLIKLTRDQNKVVYFWSGHGERDIDDTEAEGIDRLKKALEESSYEVKTLKFIENPTIPEDASVVAIVGPKSGFLPPEIQAIEDYLTKGGNLLVAIDPDKKHGLEGLTSKMGIEFLGNFIVDPFGQMVGVGAAMAVGMKYSSTSDITKKFEKPNMFTLFFLASGLNKSSSAPEGFEYEEVVSSNEQAFGIDELTERVDPKKGKPGPYTISMSVTGEYNSAASINEGDKNKGDKKEAKKFRAVVLGDSDVFSNNSIDQLFNRDLVLNTLAYLSQDEDLVSIRPKEPKKTQLFLTEVQKKSYLATVFFPLPLLFLALAIFLFFRRRSA